MTSYRVAVIPGDGIGPEVISAGMEVLNEVARLQGGFHISWTPFDWGCERYLSTGQMMPTDGLKTLRDFDAIYFGAVGDKRVADHISVWELILPIRRAFQQYVNLRPARRLKGVPSPLILQEGIDFIVVRENTEGEYSDIGGSIHEATSSETVVQTSVFTRMGVERAARYAFARQRKRQLTVVTKSNAMKYSMPFWDHVVTEVSREYPDIRLELFHIDAMTTYLVTRPHTFDVILASNLFGDILTDLGAAVVGGLGLAPSANLNPERLYPSMFEPVHGSAPDIAGKGIANPVAAIWTGVLMLDFLGQQEAASRLMDAIENVLQSGMACTPDLSGTATTVQVTSAIIAALQVAHSCGAANHFRTTKGEWK
ncbi:MAG: tartrate dehydrogenase [Bacilli bacterium]